MRTISMDSLRELRGSDATLPLVLYGAGDLGKITLHALQQKGLSVNAFCDSNRLKQGTSHHGVPVIAPEALADFDRRSIILVCNNYISVVACSLREIGFEEIYSCSDLFSDADFSCADFNVHKLEIYRKISWHKREYDKLYGARDRLTLKYIDIVITEACSMKCVDCSNLMQYYKTPKHSDLDMLFECLDRIMSAADRVDEIRVLGGEPLVNRNFGSVIDKVSEYKNFSHIVVYTNGTIVPRAPALEALADRRVTVNITDYGKHSRKLADLIDALKNQSIAYLVKTPAWTDSGRIKHVDRSHEALEFQFSNCCVNDVLTLLNGRLYRCPFSANATNLGAIPQDSADFVDVENVKDIVRLRNEIKQLYVRDTPLLACRYCNGRDYTTPKIEAAIQIDAALELPTSPTI
ncbi:radical SAM protein [Neorhizobium sp. BETTINA12A]|uniref:radical SAM protein n=1 Tax=Neorhizobium sp. BETTINA12A TaxID=2908924 RepID=UPI001FF54ADC|nr:radical SAM protein [Neorhizobium sp. BETTINA12A]MCJ9750395.1 radical SAM protein [Neorhizobium sp. BETTINA12A]